MLPFMTAMVRANAIGGLFLAALAIAGLHATEPNGYSLHVVAPPARAAQVEYRPDCEQPDACLDQKYHHYLELVAFDLASKSQAAQAFCSETTWPERTTEYLDQLLATCKAVTAERIAADLH